MAETLEALRAQLLVTERVEVAEGRGFDVSGLSLDAILLIVQRHKKDVGELFDTLVRQVGQDEGISLDKAEWLGSALLGAAPAIAAEIVTLAAGYESPEAVEVFRKVPAPIQLDALDKIARLTFTSEMPPKKVFETVVRALTGVSMTLAGSEPALQG
jgi:hypothetical protein